MATQAFPYLVITDGTTTVTIADGSGGAVNYQLDARAGAWRPTIAGFSQSQLGGRGPYDDVLESMQLDVTGATAAAATSNLQTLERLIGQAERWSRGENVSIVLIKFAPQGSTVASTAAPYQAVVMGYAAGANAACTSGEQLLMMPSAAGSMYIIRGVACRFQRRGAWLLSAAVTGTSAAVANPGPYPVTGMTTHPNISPASLTLSGFAVAANQDLDFADSNPILLLAQQGSDLVVAEAEGAADGITLTSVVDTVNVSRGGHVLRYTPAATTEVIGSVEISLSGITASARRFAFFAAIRNNSASVSFKVRVAALSQASAVGPVDRIETYTRPVVIDTTHTRPRFVPLGIVSLSRSLTGCEFGITASSIAGGPTLDIDYVIALAVDNPYSRAIQLAGTDSFSHTATMSVVVDPSPLTALTPQIYRTFSATSDIEVLGYYGDAFPVASGTTFTAAMMAKRANVLACWTYAPASGAANSLTLTVNRLDARMVPE